MAPTYSPYEILVVDDAVIDNQILEMIAHKVAKEVQITTCLNGKNAIEKLCELKSTSNQPMPKYIFVDLMMPGMDGWEFLNEYIRLNIDPTNSSNIYIITSSLFQSDLLKAKGYNIVKDFIRKPLNLDKMKEVFEIA